jgi:hypothetical protein
MSMTSDINLSQTVLTGQARLITKSLRQKRRKWGRIMSLDAAAWKGLKGIVRTLRPGGHGNEIDY